MRRYDLQAQRADDSYSTGPPVLEQTHAVADLVTVYVYCVYL